MVFQRLHHYVAAGMREGELRGGVVVASWQRVDPVRLERGVFRAQRVEEGRGGFPSLSLRFPFFPFVRGGTDGGTAELGERPDAPCSRASGR
jgi:hypothetical protein